MVGEGQEADEGQEAGGAVPDGDGARLASYTRERSVTTSIARLHSGPGPILDRRAGSAPDIAAAAATSAAALHGAGPSFRTHSTAAAFATKAARRDRQAHATTAVPEAVVRGPHGQNTA